MSLLSICQAAADQMGLDARPVSIIGNMGVDEGRLRSFASRVASDLATRASWQALRLERVFTAVAMEGQAGAIPPGFQRFSPETLWDRTNKNVITGQLSGAEYQARKNDLAGDGYTGPTRWWTRRADALLVWPAPAGGETYSFEYQSLEFCQSAAGLPQTAWLADTDTGRISEELITLGVIARFLEADGQPWQSARSDFERRLVIELANDQITPGLLPAGDIFGLGRFSTGSPTGAFLGGGW